MCRPMNQGHTSTHRGKKVLIELRTGEVIVDRFVDRTPSKYILLEKYGRVHAREIAAFITSPAIIRAKVGDK